MKKVYVSGSKVGVIEVDNVANELPVGNYSIQFNDRTGEVYLKTMDDLKMPKTEFVDTLIVDKWLTSFNHYDSNLGILLSGLKGAGKTVMAKKLCIKSGLPVLHLNSPVPCAPLAEFLANPMFHNCIVFIDEFEKVINQEDKQIAAWLKLMDGGYNTKLLFLLTSNGDQINEYLMNRLSRIKYRKHFAALSDNTIQRIIDEFLENKEFEEDLKTTCNKVTLLSIDILINIIQEINLFNEPASEVVKHLNLVNSSCLYEVHEKIGNDWLPCNSIYMNISQLDSEEIVRKWIPEYRKKVDELLYVECKVLTDLEEEVIRTYKKDYYHSFKEPKLTKIKGGYLVEDDGCQFKICPMTRSNMLF